MNNQLRLYEQVRRKIANRNRVMLDLLYGENPITGDELRRLIDLRPSVYGAYAGYLDKREEN